MQEFTQSLLALAVITLVSVFIIHLFGHLSDWIAELRRRLALQRAVADYMTWTGMPKEIALRNVPGGLESLSPIDDHAYPSTRIIADSLVSRPH